ncbi:MAG: TspO/MBR family protein [bacterium]|nr:TspO/MBR family protein [bacterium]
MNYPSQWYDALIKPSWTPPPGTISTAWTILYPIIVVSFGFIFYQALVKKKVSTKILRPFIINLITNLLFIPIFFGLKNIPLATLDILLVWATIAFIMKLTWKRYRWVALAQIPYLTWVTIAGLIQLQIFFLNR